MEGGVRPTDGVRCEQRVGFERENRRRAAAMPGESTSPPALLLLLLLLLRLLLLLPHVCQHALKGSHEGLGVHVRRWLGHTSARRACWRAPRPLRRSAARLLA